MRVGCFSWDTYLLREIASYSQASRAGPRLTPDAGVSGHTSGRGVIIPPARTQSKARSIPPVRERYDGFEPLPVMANHPANR